MNRLTALKRIHFAFLLMLLAANVSAQSVELHDVTQLADGQYDPGTTDPHFIFSYPQPKNTQGQTVWLNVSLLLKTGADGIPSESAGQFFWANDQHGFESKYSIEFQLDQPINRVAFPMELIDTGVSAIRIDIDRCACLITLAEPQWHSSSDQQSLHYPSGLDWYLDLANGRNITIDNWVGIQLNSPVTGVFEFSDWDPRIVNKDDLSVPADVAAGIYFDFDYNFSGRFQKFEVFWRLENSNWSPLSSTHFVLPNPPDGGTNRRVFIPFSNLHSKQLLLQIRLDFQACPDCRFTLNQSRIVGFREADKFAQFTPERLYYVHTEKPPAGFIRQAFIGKLSRAKGFMVFYLLLILTVGGFGLVLAFRK